jgi:trigger factor
VDGEQVEDAQASGLSYKIGSDEMLDGLDEALTGLSAGESKTFTSELTGGEKAGENAEVTVTVQSVKIQELPELDDEFAQLASEFDTLEELREDTRKNLSQQKRYELTNQARERSVEALVEALDIPLPEKFTEHEFGHARETVDNQLARMSMTLEQYLETQEEEQTPEEFETELRTEAEKSVRNGIALDLLVESEKIEVSQAELSYFVSDQAQRMGVPPQQLAQQLAEAGQLTVAMNEVARSKASASLSEKVKVVDTDGNEIDLKALVEEINSEMEAMMAAQMAQFQAAQEAAQAASDAPEGAEVTESAADEAPAVVEGEVVSSEEAPAAEADAEA